VHILKAEQRIITDGASVFAWPQQEKECDGDHICYSMGVIVPGHAICVGEDKDDDIDGNWLNSFGRRVLSLVRLDLTLYPEVNVSMEVFPDIRGPHLGERLSDRT
jgi:hypothetical protein